MTGQTAQAPGRSFAGSYQRFLLDNVCRQSIEKRAKQDDLIKNHPCSFFLFSFFFRTGRPSFGRSVFLSVAVSPRAHFLVVGGVMVYASPTPFYSVLETIYVFMALSTVN